MLKQLSEWVITEPTTPKQANDYIGLMAMAYPIVFLLAVAGPIKAALIACWATGFMDVWLYLQGKVRTRLPLSIPLGVVGILGMALHAFILKFNT